MGAIRKPGFRYQNSEALGQEIAISDATGAVYCEDGVCYSPEEVALLRAAGGKIDKNAHAVKKALQGTIVQIITKPQDRAHSEKEESPDG